MGVESDPEAVAGCEPCEIAARLERDGELFPITSGWTVNAATAWSNRPWLVLQTRRHRPHLADLDEGEAVELGPLIRALTTVTAEMVDAERVYVYLLNEAEPPHVHFHVVARFADDLDAVRGPALLNRPASEGTAWLPEIVERIVDACRTMLDHQPHGSHG